MIIIYNVWNKIVTYDAEGSKAPFVFVRRAQFGANIYETELKSEKGKPEGKPRRTMNPHS